MKVFVVMGSTGEYSDRNEWTVRAFFDRDRANAFEFECTKEAKTYHDNRNNEIATPTGYRRATPAEIAEFRARTITKDPFFQHDYAGTDYYTAEVETEGMPDFDAKLDGVRAVLDALLVAGGEASANATDLAKALGITLKKAPPPPPQVPVELGAGGQPFFLSLDKHVMRARVVQVSMRRDVDRIYSAYGDTPVVTERPTVITLELIADRRFEEEKAKP